MVEVNELLQFVSNNGFSIVVAMYSLTRLERTMKENTEVMKEVLRSLKGGKVIE